MDALTAARAARPNPTRPQETTRPRDAAPSAPTDPKATDPMATDARPFDRNAVDGEMRNALNVQSLCVAYDERMALFDVSLAVKQGEVYGILGPNGAGKSTLAKAIAGRAPICDGSASVANAPAGTPQARTALGFAPQRCALYDRLTARENLVIFGMQAGLRRSAAQARAKQLIGRVGAASFADKETRRLSGGERQRINIAAAVVHEPAFVILDEPCASIDPVGVAALNAVIKDLAADGLGVLLITHDMEQAEAVCHRVGVLVSGILADEGRPCELITRLTGRRLAINVEMTTDDRPPRNLAQFKQSGPSRWRATADDFDEVARLIADLRSADLGPCAVSSVDVRRLGLEAVVARLADAGDDDHASSDH